MSPEDSWARSQLDRMEIAMQAHEQHDTDRFEEIRDRHSD